MDASRAFVIALLGAESTGKTLLALALREALAQRGDERVAVVPEYLREFCDLHGRTPLQHEQAAIAQEQTRRIEAAAATHDIVIADTTALMIAVYSDLVFSDTSLYASSQQAHARCDLTLLTALDLPWQPDGLQRDGPHVREPVDARLRAALARAGCDFGVIFGRDAARLDAALGCVARARSAPAAPTDGPMRWQWHCERCGDASCERHRLPQLS
jgi:nicotinamide riboside kinase